MANLQPEIDRIKEEYKDNQDLVSLFLVRPVSLRLVSCESEVRVRDAGPLDSTVHPTMRDCRKLEDHSKNVDMHHAYKDRTRWRSFQRALAGD